MVVVHVKILFKHLPRRTKREREREKEEEDSWSSHIIFEHKPPPDITCLQVFIQ